MTKTTRFHSEQVPSDDIESRTLRMSMYDVDKRRVRHSLGHVLLHLHDVDLTKEDLLWRDLEPVSQVAECSKGLYAHPRFLFSTKMIPIM